MSTSASDPHVAAAAIVVAGGASRRWGGVDKLAVMVSGRALLDWTIDGLAAGGADPIVCVGKTRGVAQPVTWCSEDPPGGGPLAAVVAALGLLSSDLVWLAAGDQPLFGGAMPALAAALGDADAAVLTDDRGRRHHLAALWRVEAIRGAAGPLGDGHGLAMRRLYDQANCVEVPDRGWADDADTAEALAALRARLHP